MRDEIFEYLDTKEAQDELKDFQFESWKDKYKDINFCFKSGNWNIPLLGSTIVPEHFAKQRTL